MSCPYEEMPLGILDTIMRCPKLMPITSNFLKIMVSGIISVNLRTAIACL